MCYLGFLSCCRWWDDKGLFVAVRSAHGGCSGHAGDMEVGARPLRLKTLKSFQDLKNVQTLSEKVGQVGENLRAMDT